MLHATDLAADAEVRQYESLLDSHVRAQPMPSGNRASSIWHVLTVAEDSIRNAWREISASEDLISALKFIVFLMNSYKYGLRYSLQAIHEQQTADRFCAKPRLSEQSYRMAGDLLQVFTDYETAVRAFTSYYNGTAICSLDPKSSELVFEIPRKALAANALDVLLPMSGDEPSALLFLLMWLADLAERPSVVAEIASRVSAGKLRIDYSYNTYFARELMEQLPAFPRIIPDEWEFPWATASQARVLLEALATRAIYHLLAVDIGSDLLIGRGTPAQGRGVGNICLLTTRRKLASELSGLSGLPISQVTQFVEYLTYGVMTQTPDPALQPLIPIGEDCLALPAFQVVSSNSERNILSLHARIDKHCFDSHSHLFEKQMMCEISAVVSRRFSNYRVSSYIPGSRQAGEVDLIVADPSSHTMLIGELRWTLPPGDAREVHNRKKVMREKVLQLRRKLGAAREHVQELFELVGVDHGNTSQDDWRIVGLVVVDGYYGQLAEETDDIVIVPQKILTIGIDQCESLWSIYVWLRSMRWIPQEGHHYARSTSQFIFGDRAVRWEGLQIHGAGDEYLAHVKGSCIDLQKELKRC